MSYLLLFVCAKVLLVFFGFFADVLSYVVVGVFVFSPSFFHSFVEKVVFFAWNWYVNIEFFSFKLIQSAADSVPDEVGYGCVSNCTMVFYGFVDFLDEGFWKNDGCFKQPR